MLPASNRCAEVPKSVRVGSAYFHGADAEDRPGVLGDDEKADFLSAFGGVSQKKNEAHSHRRGEGFIKHNEYTKKI
ncbi:MAG: hypothetical protein MUF31_08775 [Akkermansiaceae bacterium]|jgi:hypothetical protein|nr:hypothetical protein [Akkermansiaceae bacterium]